MIVVVVVVLNGFWRNILEGGPARARIKTKFATLTRARTLCKTEEAIQSVQRGDYLACTSLQAEPEIKGRPT